VNIVRKKVICVDNFNDYYSPNIKEKNIEEAKENAHFILHKTDITNKESLRDIFINNNIDKIIHLAARAGVRPSFQDPTLYQKVNIEGTRNLLELVVCVNILK